MIKNYKQIDFTLTTNIIFFFIFSLYDYTIIMKINVIAKLHQYIDKSN